VGTTIYKGFLLINQASPDLDRIPQISVSISLTRYRMACKCLGICLANHRVV